VSSSFGDFFPNNRVQKCLLIYDVGFIQVQENQSANQSVHGQKKFGRDPRLSATSMAAPLHGTPMIVGAHNSLAVCMRHRNLPQTLELPNSSSHTFRSKASSRFNSMRASSSSADSSVNLAKSNLHAHSLQVQNSIPFELETMSPFQKQTQDFV